MEFTSSDKRRRVTALFHQIDAAIDQLQDWNSKYNVSPEVVQVFNHGFKKHEISIIEGVIEENAEVIIDRWKSFFNTDSDK